MTKMSQENTKVATRKIPATNDKFGWYLYFLIQPALFQEIPATNYKILVRTGTGTRDSSKIKISQ